MNCNCNWPLANFPFPQAGCCPSNFSNPGPYPCRPHFPSVRSNFVTPPINTDVIIELTDTQSFTIGQGILIGTTFYQITDILDALRITAQHNGIGLAAGTVVIAVNPQYGCYQYPVVPAGMVSLLRTPDIQGLDLDADTAVASSITVTTVNKMIYGYEGPTTLAFQIEFDGTVANTPHWIGFQLPVSAMSGTPTGAFSAFIRDGGEPLIAIGKMGAGSFSDYVVVGKGNSGQFSNGASRQVVVSGKIEIAV